MSGNTFYVEGSAGASGDMLLAALLDLGFPQSALEKTLKELSLPIKFQVKEVKKNSLLAKQVVPDLPPKEKKEWKPADFLKVIEKSKLPGKLKEQSTKVFERLALAEAKVHGKKPNALHFHELGGWDTLFDVVGSLAAIDFLNPAEILVGPLNVGEGFVRTQHGVLPVPPPAVCELLKGFSIFSGTAQGELVTPTGAVLLSATGKPVKSIPPMILEKLGGGAGQKMLPIPNVLRIFSGKPLHAGGEELVLKLETNIDDMSPQLWEHVVEKLYESGALEVFLTPVFMKKMRPATLLTILAPLAKEETLTDLLFAETTTIGVRREITARKILKRKIVRFKTSYGKIPCKMAYKNGRVMNLMPEYEHLKKISLEKGIPLKKLYQDILRELPPCGDAVPDLPPYGDLPWPEKL